MPEQANRRQAIRYEVMSQGIKVHEQVSGQRIGTVANLSAGGLMMIGDRKARVGQSTGLQLRWTSGHTLYQLDFVATLLWQSPTADDVTYWSGHMISDISLGDHADLLMLAEAGVAIE